MKPDGIDEQVARIHEEMRTWAANSKRFDLHQLGAPRLDKPNRLLDLSQDYLGPALSMLRDLLETIDATSGVTAPAPILIHIYQNAFVPMREAVKAMEEFSTRATNENAAESRAATAKRVENEIDKAIGVVDGALRRRATSMDAQQMAESGHALIAELNKKSDAVDRVLGNAREALETVQKAAIQKGVNEQGEAFAKAADAHKKTAGLWAYAAAGLAAAVLAVAGYTVAYGNGPPSPASAWWVAGNLAYFGARLLIVSVLSFLLVVAVRNFRAEKHNEIANRHRHGALATFAQFQTWAQGPAGDAVVLQVSEAIFGAAATAYRDKEDSESTHVTELLKLVDKSGKASK